MYGARGAYGQSEMDEEAVTANLSHMPFSQVQERGSVGSGLGVFRWGRLPCWMAIRGWASLCCRSIWRRVSPPDVRCPMAYKG